MFSKLAANELKVTSQLVLIWSKEGIHNLQSQQNIQLVATEQSKPECGLWL